MKHFCFLRLMALLFIVVFSVGHVDAAPDTEKFNIGVILAMSGEWANIAAGAKGASQLAYQDLPVEIKQKVKIIYEDDQLHPAKSVSAFHKLNSVDNVDAVITWSSGTSKAVAPLAEKEKIPMIAIASDPTVAAGRKYVFNLWVTPEVETDLIIPETRKRDYSKIIRVTTEHDGALACAKAYDAFKGEKPEVVLDRTYPPKEKDFRSLVAKIRSIKDFDAILALFNPGQLGLFAKQLRTAGVNVPLFGYEMFEDPNEIKVAEGALEGSWFATAGNADGQFEAKFKSAYPDAIIVTASNTYDALTLLAKGGSKLSNSNEVAEYLSSLKNYNGASGVFSSTDDNRFTLPAILKVVRGNGVELLE